MKRNLIYLLLFVAFAQSFMGCPADHKSTLCSEHWVAEDQSKALVADLKNDTLEMIVPAGLTYWYDELLTGNYQISYDISMVMKNGEHDRLSDLNCFWGAVDPENPENIYARSEWRNGVFKNYNTLNLFYVGYGGNHNSTTRFRRYHAEFYGVDESKIKPVLKEYSDADHLLKPNFWYHIVITVKDDYTTYAVNGEELFRQPITKGQCDGYFGLRLLKNHVLLTNFKTTPLN